MPPRPERGLTRPGEPARMPAAGRICGQDLGPASCTGAVFARGRCRRHYRLEARGGVPGPAGPEPGSPSGHGRWGILDVDEAGSGRLVCHECGRTYIALGVHVAMAHGITVREYRLRHGLLMSASLSAPALAAVQAELARTPQSIARLEAARSPGTLAGVPQDLITRGVRLRYARPKPGA
jgi:ROS/MUCR transcriptional regulator protein